MLQIQMLGLQIIHKKKGDIMMLPDYFSNVTENLK